MSIYPTDVMNRGFGVDIVKINTMIVCVEDVVS